MITSTDSIPMASQFNRVPRAGHEARLAWQHGCRTPNAATRAWRAGKATNPARDGTADSRQSSSLPYRQPGRL